MINAAFFISLLILSQAATLIRFADASSLAICFWRLAIAGAILAPVAFGRTGRTELRRLVRSDVWHLALSGFLLFVHFYFFFRSVQETSIANSTILFSLNPVTTALGAWLMFRERVTSHLVVACALGFVGIVVLFGEQWFDSSFQSTATSLHGNLWSIASATCFSGYILTGKKLRLKLSNSTFASTIYLQTAVYASIAMLIVGDRFTEYTPITWWMFVALAVFPTLLGHAVFTYCLNYLDVNFMSCMTLIEPIFAAIAAHYLFGEPMSHYAAVGFLFTCASVVALYWPWINSRFRARVRP
ncbi:MAG: EamA family transporter [Bdellovibrionota bacterium]